MDTSFAPYRDEFLGHISDIVCCTATTVDLCGRPRSRMLHPIWEIINGLPVGWVVTSKTPVKTAHLKENPHMACMYWNPNQHTVSIDTIARWASAQEKLSVWNLFMTTSPPLGYDLSGFGEDQWNAELFNLLRLDPWRIQMLRAEQLARLELVPRTWLRVQSARSDSSG